MSECIKSRDLVPNIITKWRIVTYETPSPIYLNLSGKLSTTSPHSVIIMTQLKPCSIQLEFWWSLGTHQHQKWSLWHVIWLRTIIYSNIRSYWPVTVSCRLADDSSSVLLHNVIDVSPLEQVTSARHKLRAIDKAMVIKTNKYTEAVLMSHFLHEFEGWSDEWSDDISDLRWALAL